MDYITKNHIFKEIERITYTPEFIISNYNFELTPFIIIVGNKAKKYYMVKTKFIFISEKQQNKSIQSFNDVRESQNNLKLTKEYQDAQNIFLQAINVGIDQSIKQKKEVMFVTELDIVLEKKYKVSVSITQFPFNNIIRMKHETLSIGEKYKNKIETAIQCAGDRGITTTELIVKTQLLAKHERQGLLDYLVTNKTVTVKQEKKGPKMKNTYYWNNDHE